MINPITQQRELCYVTIIEEIREIPGYDRVEHARVGGWWVIVQKGQFHVGDPAIYFEIDSRVPSDRECFAFLEKRNYKVKTLKMCKVISQGLLMHPSDFGWEWHSERMFNTEFQPVVIDDKGNEHRLNDETRFLTKELGVIYADSEDNQRKAPSIDKYKKMAQRHPKIFKQGWARWMMKRDWGKKVMFALFGKQKDKKNNWPVWVQKTDEERVQNMPWILNDEGEWIITEKLHGSSTTFTMKRAHGVFNRKNQFYVCSRNVCFDSIDKPCYYDINIYWEMAKKYNMYEVLNSLLEHMPNAEWVTIQGETFGSGVQRRDYSIPWHDFRAFNLITSDRGRWNSVAMKNLLENGYDVPCVPIIDCHFEFSALGAENERMDNLLKMATGDSLLDDKPREGFVLRSSDGTRSFKAVSNEFLLKYHG